MIRKYLLSALFISASSFKLLAQNASSIIPDSVSKRDTARQTDLIDIGRTIFHVKSRNSSTQKNKHIYFSFLPGSTVPGGTGRALVTSTTAGVYLGPNQTTNLSSATFAPYWNFGSRYGLPLRTSVWLPDNRWTIQGDIRFLHYPQSTWGLGTSRKDDENTLIDYDYIRIYQSVLKQIRPFLFAGIGYAYDRHSNIHADDKAIDLKEFTGYVQGTSGSSVSSGITFNLLYDSRNNLIRAQPGTYANLIYRVNPTLLGSNNNSHTLYVDLRKYVPLNPKKTLQQNTLALWGYFWTAFNNNTPYLDLPSIGWDVYNRSGRGIDQNRFRGPSLLYLESEYRRDITSNGLLGFVVFANVNTVSGSGTMFTSWHPAGGTGLRLKFSKATRTNVGIDFGVSKQSSAILLNVGEAF